MSSTSSGCQPKRSASSCAVSRSGPTTLTQVSPLAVELMDGDGPCETLRMARNGDSCGCGAGSASVLRGSSIANTVMFGIVALSLPRPVRGVHDPDPMRAAVTLRRRWRVGRATARRRAAAAARARARAEAGDQAEGGCAEPHARRRSDRARSRRRPARARSRAATRARRAPCSARAARLGQVGDERSLDGAVEALADAEHRHHASRGRPPPRARERRPDDGTSSQHAAQIDAPAAASARMRRCPSESRVIGSCASTITSRVDEEDEPDRGLARRRPRSSRTPAGARRRDIPAKMKSALRPITPMKARCRRTTQ